MNFKITLSGGRRANMLAGKGLFLLSSGAAERFLPLKIQGFVPHGCAAVGRVRFSPIITGSAPADGLWAADARAARPW